MIDVVIIGCGWRGQVFAEYAKDHPDEMRVLASQKEGRRGLTDEKRIRDGSQT